MSHLKPGDTVSATVSLSVSSFEGDYTFQLVPHSFTRNRHPLYRAGDVLGTVVKVHGDLVEVESSPYHPLRIYLSHGAIRKEDQ